MSRTRKNLSTNHPVYANHPPGTTGMPAASVKVAPDTIKNWHRQAEAFLGESRKNKRRSLVYQILAGKALDEHLGQHGYGDELGIPEWRRGEYRAAWRAFRATVPEGTPVSEENLPAHWCGHGDGAIGIKAVYGLGREKRDRVETPNNVVEICAETQTSTAESPAAAAHVGSLVAAVPRGASEQEPVGDEEEGDGDSPFEPDDPVALHRRLAAIFDALPAKARKVIWREAPDEEERAALLAEAERLHRTAWLRIVERPKGGEA